MPLLVGSASEGASEREWPFSCHVPRRHLHIGRTYRGDFKMRKFSLIYCLAVLVIASFAALAGAQSIDGTLRGEVTDPSGAVVAGAKVTATNVGTNVSTEAISSSSGTFNFPNLLPGTYKVTVETSGFQAYTRDGSQVRTNQITEVNPRLSVAGTTAEVEVVTGAEVVQTDHQLVSTFDANQIVHLPFSEPLGAHA